jgi:hypothetical protein
VDYKTKKTTEGEPIVPYPEQKMQIAAYWHAAFPVWLDSPMGGCNIFISSTEPGRVEAHWYDKRGARGRLGDLQGLPRPLEAGQEIRERLVNPKT